MAGVVIHLAVADATYENLKIMNLPLYYAGNIAPELLYKGLYFRHRNNKQHRMDNKKLFYRIC